MKDARAGKWLEGLKKYRLAALAALLGIVLMLLPGGNAEAEPTAGSPDAEAFDRAAVQEEMENILRAIDGVGELRLMLTVDSGTKRELARLVKRYDINTIVIGNGTASRETEEVVSSFIVEAAPELRYTIVNEAGASVYSASQLASEEYPDLDVTTRGAMSLGRRLQDPLAELVKIPPQSIGVGQYQHDLNQAELGRALAGVVERVVNRVGVDLNTASASLLGYVSGVNTAVARNIVAYREEHGRFSDRRELKKVPKLGAKAYQNCAGFLRVAGGANPLDATSVHPESYPVARELLKRAKVKPEALARGGVPDIASRLGDLPALAAELGVGLPTLRDTVKELMKLQGFSFRYEFSGDAQRTAYDEEYAQVYEECHNLLVTGGYRVYTSLNEQKQEVLQQMQCLFSHIVCHRLIFEIIRCVGTLTGRKR